ncbi:MAG: hypothetical protein LUC18_05380 [Porphyromonadaceae bacterium]|nr:hypothetical protein [Porphyromonadaceae bacterium]
MAGSPRNAVESLRIHVTELMSRHTALRERCRSLEAALREREESLEALRRELETLQAKYENLSTAQALASHEGDLTAVRSRFDKLVREIDKCISLLKE